MFSVPEFSVLLPVYHADDPDHFVRAIESVTKEQELPPSELVIVRDGPVGDALARVIDSAVGGALTAGVPVTLVALATNSGLATALQRGLAACRFDIVGRADADDISLPGRFAAQIPALVEGGIDLLGSAVTEFTTESQLGRTRQLPHEAEEIRRVARFRDPFNHPSVVYRKAAVASAGGYEHLNKMEDYLLFVRMIAAGASVANLRESLVLYRVGAGAYDRRGGLEMLVTEIRLQYRLLRSGFTTPLEGLRNLAVRGGYRLIPTWLRRPLYRSFLAR